MEQRKQTAVDWLITQLEGEESLVARIVGLKEYNQIVKQAKQMEKEQIIDARANGFMSSAEGWNGEIPCMKWSELVRETKCEEYYNETYGK
jgi:hypothetical protein